MSLREKAEAEVAEDQRKAQERRESDQQYRERQHYEEAKPAAEWLAKWSGCPVEPEDLKKNDTFFHGFHSYTTWIIRIEDFDLILKQQKRQKPMLEEHTPDWDFQLHQRLSLSETRRIDRPADLLEPEPVTVGVSP